MLFRKSSIIVHPQIFVHQVCGDVKPVLDIGKKDTLKCQMPNFSKVSYQVVPVRL